MCRLCNNLEENQVHVLQECQALEQLNLQKAIIENIFNNITKPPDYGELCQEITEFVVVEDHLSQQAEGDLPPPQTKYSPHTAHQTKVVLFLYLTKLVQINKFIICFDWSQILLWKFLHQNLYNIYANMHRKRIRLPTL